MQANQVHALNCIEQMALIICDKTFHIACENAILVEHCPCSFKETVLSNIIATTRQHIATFKIVECPINFIPEFLIKIRTIAVTTTISIMNPYTGGQFAILFKLIGDTCNLVPTTYICHGLGREIIPFIVNGLPTTGQLAKVTIAVYIAILEHTGILQHIHADAVLAEVIVVLASFAIVSGHLLYTGDHLTIAVVGISYPTTAHDTVFIFNAIQNAIEQITAIRTLTHAVDDLIMVVCRDNCTPVYHRLTHFTEGSAGVTVFGAGCSLVRQQDCIYMIGRILIVVGLGFRSVVMATVPAFVPRRITNVVQGCRTTIGIAVTAQLGGNLNLGAGEGILAAILIIHKDAIDFHIQAHRQDTIDCLPIVVHVDLTIVAINGLDNRKLPGTDRNRNQNLVVTGQVGLPCCSNGNNCNVLICNQRIAGFEALRYFHVLQLPHTDIIQVQRNHNRGNGFRIIRNHIDIVQRSRQNPLRIGITGNDLDLCILCRTHNNGSNNGGVVAHFVTHREFHCMHTIRQHHIIQRQSQIGQTGYGYQVGIIHTINICAGTIQVQTGIVILNHVIGYDSRETNCIGIDHMIPQGLCLIHAINKIGHVSKNRALTIVNSLRIVNGNVVHIQHILAVNIILLAIDIAVLTILQAHIELQGGQTAVFSAGYINSDIVPTGLIECTDEASICRNGFTAISNANIRCDITAGDVNTIAANIGRHLAIDHNTVCFVREIDPHTNRQRIMQVHAFSGNQSTQHEACLQRIGVIQLHRHRVVAAKHMATVLVGKIGFTANLNGIVLGCCATIPTVQVLILKVVQNFRTLTHKHRYGCGQLRIMYQSCLHVCHIDDRCMLLRYSGKLQAINGTNRRTQLKIHICAIQQDLKGTVVSRNTDHYRLAIRHGHCCIIICEAGRNHNIDADRSDQFAIIICRNGLFTDCTIGDEYTILIGTTSCLVGNTLRHFSRHTGSINALDANAHITLRGNILVFSQHRHMVKYAAGCSLGGNDNTMDGGTRHTVRGDVTQDIVTLALTLRQDLRGTATVTVNCPNAAQCQHGFAQLIGAQAIGIGRVTAFHLHNHQRTIRLDTQHRAVSTAGMVYSGSLQLAVFHGKAEVTSECLPLVTVQLFTNLTQFAANSTIFVLCNCQIGIAVFIEEATGGGQYLAIVYQECARRIGGIGQRSIHTCDHVVAQLVTIVVHGLLHGLCRPVVGVCQILVNSIVARQDLHIGVIGIHFHNVHNLSTGATIIIDDDFRFCNAIAQNIVLLGNHIVVTIGNAFIIVNTKRDGQYRSTQLTSALMCIVNCFPLHILMVAIHAGLCNMRLTAAAQIGNGANIGAVACITALLHISMQVLANAIDPYLQIIQLDIGQMVATSALAKEGEGQILTIEPVFGVLLVGGCLIVVVHGADFNTVNHQVDHIGTVFIDAVFQAEHMFLLNIKVSSRIDTIVLVFHAGIRIVSTQGQQVAGILAENEVHAVCIARTTGQQHTIPVTAGFPFDDPFLVMIQYDRCLHTINDICKPTLCDGTSQQCQLILRVATGNDADHGVGFRIVFPAISVESVRFVATAMLTVTAKLVGLGHPFTVLMVAQFRTIFYLTCATATSISGGTNAGTVGVGNFRCYIGMLVLRTIEPNLHVFRLPALDIVVATHTKELKHQILTAEPVAGGALIRCGIEVVVHGTDFHIVNDQIDHIGNRAIGFAGDSVLQTEGVGATHIGSALRVIDAIIMEGRTNIGTQTQTQIGSAEEDTHIGSTCGGSAEQDTAPIAGGGPLNYPFLFMGQCNLMLHLVLNRGELAAGNRSLQQRQRIADIDIVRDAFKSITCFIHFPTITSQNLCYRIIAQLALTVQLAVPDLPGIVSMACALLAIGYGIIVTAATSIGKVAFRYTSALGFRSQGIAMTVFPAALYLDFQIFQCHAADQMITAVADILKGQIHAIGIVASGALIGRTCPIIVHRADFYIVDQQIHRVDTVLVNTVLQTVDMHLLNINQICCTDTIVMVHAVGTITNRQQICATVTVDILDTIGHCLSRRKQHTLPVTAGLPLNDPFLLVGQRKLVSKGIAHAGQLAIFNRTSLQSQCVLGVTVSRHIDQAGALFIHLPTIIQIQICITIGKCADLQIAGHVRNGNLTIGIALSCNILAIHGNGHIQILHTLTLGQGRLIGATIEHQVGSIVGCHIGQAVFDLASCILILQHSSQTSLGDLVHTQIIGVDTLVTHIQVELFRIAADLALQINISAAHLLNNLHQAGIERSGLANIGTGVDGVTACHQAQAVNLDTLIANLHLVQHDGICLINRGGFGIGIGAITIFGPQRIIVHCICRTPGLFIIAVVIGAHEHHDHIGFFTGVIIVQLNTAIHIGTHSACALRQDCTTGPGVIDTKFHAQHINDLLPPGIFLPNVILTAIGIILLIITQGSIVGGIIGNFVVCRDTVAKNRYFLAGKMLHIQFYQLGLVARFGIRLLGKCLECCCRNQSNHQYQRKQQTYESAHRVFHY